MPRATAGQLELVMTASRALRVSVAAGRGLGVPDSAAAAGLQAIDAAMEGRAPGNGAAVAKLLVENYDLLLLDLDGVVYRGGQAVVHAIESIRKIQEMGIPVGFVTNNSSRTPTTIANQLRGYGLELEESAVVSSAETAVKMLSQRISSGSVYVVGGEGLRSAVVAGGFELVDSAEAKPDAVLQCYSPDVGWRDLAEAAFAIQGGAIWIATNQDWTLPLERGLAPGNGTLVSAVHTAVGILPDFAGKPATPIFEEAVTRFAASRPLFVGDRLDTDSRGANTAGLDNAIVLTGVATPKELVGARPEDRPNFILDDLRGLLSEYPSYRTKRDSVRGEGVTAELFGNRVLIAKGDPSSTAALRAASQLVWNAPVAVYALDVDSNIYERGLADG